MIILTIITITIVNNIHIMQTKYMAVRHLKIGFRQAAKLRNDRVCDVAVECMYRDLTSALGAPLHALQSAGNMSVTHLGHWFYRTVPVCSRWYDAVCYVISRGCC